MEELYFVRMKSQEAVIFSPSYLHIAMSNYLTLTDQHAKLAFPYVPIRLYRAHHESLVSKFVVIPNTKPYITSSLYKAVRV